MFMDEARFGRINRPVRCWAPPHIRPVVDCQTVREYTYAYGGVCPHDGVLDSLILPTMHSKCFELFAGRRHRGAGPGGDPAAIGPSAARAGARRVHQAVEGEVDCADGL
jgi:hypothetical protein